jgi:hypothetical protein
MWDDIKKTIKNGVSVAAQKTEEYTKVGKIKVDIFNIKRTIDKAYSDIGEEVFALLSANPKAVVAQNPKVLELVKAIVKNKQDIEAKEKEIEALKKDEEPKKETPPPTTETKK